MAAMTKARHIFLSLIFIGIIWAVPITQAIIEIQDGESPTILSLFTQAPTEENLRSLESDLEEYSVFEEQLRPVFQLFHYVASRDMGAKALPGKEGWFFFHPGVSYLCEPYFRDRKHRQVQASGAVVGDSKEDSSGGDPVEIIVDFVQQMQARGIQVLVLPIPGKASIYPDKLTSWAERGSPVYANTSRFVDELEAKGVKVLALHGAFVEKRPEADARGKPLYMASDTHWTGEGVHIAARLIAQEIRKEDWFQERTGKTRYTRKALHVGRRGDIPEMTKLPLQEFLFSGESVVCWQVSEAKEGRAYEDDPDSPILLIGDSFSRVFQTDAPQSAGLIANLAYELQMHLASIVNNGGASTLVRQQLARRLDLLKNKRLIIWEFVERDIRFGMQGWQKISFAEDLHGICITR